MKPDRDSPMATRFFDRTGADPATISLRVDIYQTDDAGDDQMTSSVNRFETGIQGYEIRDISGVAVGDEAKAISDSLSGSYNGLFRRDNAVALVGVTAGEPDAFEATIDDLVRELDRRIREGISGDN